MTERRVVRNTGRPTYGRAQPLRTPRRAPVKHYRMGALPRRLLVIALVLGGGVMGALHLLAVTQITVMAPNRQNEIKSEFVKVLDGSWRQGNLLTFDEDSAETGLQQMDPALRTVTVRRHWPHSVSATVTLRQPSLGWSSGNQRYLLDRDGTAISAYPAGSTLPVVNDGSNLPVTLGQRVAPQRFVVFVGDLIPALVGQKLGVKSLDIKDTTLDLTVTTDKGYKLIFDTSRSVSDGMIDLKAVLALLQAQKKVPAEYIDLRVAGKAYYK